MTFSWVHQSISIFIHICSRLVCIWEQNCIPMTSVFHCWQKFCHLKATWLGNSLTSSLCSSYGLLMMVMIKKDTTPSMVLPTTISKRGRQYIESQKQHSGLQTIFPGWMGKWEKEWVKDKRKWQVWSTVQPLVSGKIGDLCENIIPKKLRNNAHLIFYLLKSCSLMFINGIGLLHIHWFLIELVQ